MLTGAGLSIPEPSQLMSAVGVARHCYDKYGAIEQLPAAMRDDIDALAGHFLQQGTWDYFIETLVPWGSLAGEPNAGHTAIGDFLLTTAAYASLTANFDTLVEQWCYRQKVPFRGALDGVQANAYAAEARPLLKFHGCMTLDRENTLWTTLQTGLPPANDRIESCRAWMQQHLPQKDLLIVGFWTDWGYLNGVLADLLGGQNPATVTVIDYSPTAALEAKAPALWALLSDLPGFTHVEMSSDEALSELRAEFSKVWVRRLLQKGRPLYEDWVGDCAAHHLVCPNLQGDELYDIRRDAEGTSYMKAARTKEPADEAGQIAFTRMLLHDAGAQIEGAWFRLNDRSIRVVNGRGRALSMVQQDYDEPPSAGAADIVICANAFNGGLPGNLVRGSGDRRVTRQSRGGASQWMSTRTAGGSCLTNGGGTHRVCRTSLTRSALLPPARMRFIKRGLQGLMTVANLQIRF